MSPYILSSIEESVNICAVLSRGARRGTNLGKKLGFLPVTHVASKNSFNSVGGYSLIGSSYDGPTNIGKLESHRHREHILAKLGNMYT